MRKGDQRQWLEHVVRSNLWFMRLLEAVRACDAPDCFIGGGAIRNLAWDHLHRYETATPLADVDVGFFDPEDLDRDRDAAVEAQLRDRLPAVPWQAKNQAAVHLWYPAVFGYQVPPLTSSEDAISTYPETVTSIGIRLLADDRLQIMAPLGLDDLLNLTLRRNPRRVTVQHFRQRLQKKKILEKWPRVRVVDG